jgi:hypothetical protein
MSSIQQNLVQVGESRRTSKLIQNVVGSGIPHVMLAVMAVQFKQANGGKLPQHAPKPLPAGVVGLDGWADRLLVVSFYLWVGLWLARR